MSVGLGFDDPVFDFFVTDYSSLVHVYEKHFSGFEAAFFDDLVAGYVYYPNFAGHDDQVVFGNPVAAGAQTIAVQYCTHDGAIGEGNRGWAVPGFHQGGVKLVERFLVVIHGGMTFPRFGDHDHHGFRQRIPAHG